MQYNLQNGHKDHSGQIEAISKQASVHFQTAFVPGRRGMNNAIIVQELNHTISRKKGRVGYMAIKIDLKKD